MSKYFCPIPFSSMEIDTIGDVRPCCYYNDFVRKDNGEKFNAADDGFADIFNSIWYKNMRQKMLNDEYDAGCSKCYLEEQNGSISRRLREIERFNKFHFDTVQGDIMIMDIKLGNTCNLSCVICNPFSSSKVLDENIRLGIIERPTKIEYKRFKWYDNDLFWEQLQNFGLENLTYIDIMGGEPMLAAKHTNFLQYLIDKGISKNIHINYVTNGTIFSTKITEKFKHFKCVDITLSADGINEVFEYSRFPAKWNVVKTNLKKYEDLNCKITVSYSVSVYSIFDIFNSLEFYFNNTNANVWFNFVYNEDRSIQILPSDLKEHFKQLYQKYFKEEWKKILPTSNIESIIQFMEAEDNYAKYWQSFVERTKKLDAYRKNNLLDAIPQLQNYY